MSNYYYEIEREKYLKILEEKKIQYIDKNSKYGAAYIKIGEILNIILEGKPIVLKNSDDHISFALITRRLEKICRYINLRFLTKDEDEDENYEETLSETLGDDGNQAFMLAAFETDNSIINSVEMTLKNDEYIKKSEKTNVSIIKKFINILKTDKEYFKIFKDNISISFQDEYHNFGRIYKRKEDVKKISESAAKSFLNRFTK